MLSVPNLNIALVRDGHTKQEYGSFVIYTYGTTKMSWSSVGTCARFVLSASTVFASPMQWNNQLASTPMQSRIARAPARGAPAALKRSAKRQLASALSGWNRSAIRLYALRACRGTPAAVWLPPHPLLLCMTAT